MSISKTERLFNLMVYLLESPRPATLEEICSCVEGYGEDADSAALKRKFERDKNELRELGVPIEYADIDVWGSEKGYAISKDKYFLPEIHFSPDESMALSIAGAILGDSFPFAGDLASALLKVQFDVAKTSENSPGTSTDNAPRVEVVLGRKQTPQSTRNLVALNGALRNHKKVEFEYLPLGGRQSRRTIRPYGLYYGAGSWYLVGFCELRNGVRCFNVGRIIGEVVVNPKNPQTPDFEPPSDFSINNYVSKEVWERDEGIDGVIPTRAQVRFSPRTAPLMERYLSGKAELKAEADGSLVACVDVYHEEFFLRWIFSQGDDVEIVSPETLRKAALERLAAIEAAYGSGGAA